MEIQFESKYMQDISSLFHDWDLQYLVNENIFYKAIK